MSALWEESNMPADNRPVTIHCKAGSTSVRLVFESRAKCQDLVVPGGRKPIYASVVSVGRTA